MNPPVLRVDQAARKYGPITALDAVDLTLARGEWVALLGPNGAGKTTLMRAIAGRVHLDGGTIQIDGAAAGGKHARRVTGVVPQHLALYPTLTVRENLNVFGRFHGVSGVDLRERVARALDWSGLADRGDHRAGHLSGGMQRRLNIACGTLHEPVLLLLDEPTVGVDAPSRDHLHGMLADLRNRGTTILESTHQLEVVEADCDSVLIMSGGRLLASGGVQDLINASRLTGHVCRITLDRHPETLDPGPGFEIDGTVVAGTVRAVADELGELLEKIRGADLGVREVRIDPPRLEDVFLHITGGETPH